MAALLRYASKSRTYAHPAGGGTRRLAAATAGPAPSHPVSGGYSAQVRSTATPSRKYYMIGGDRGVGKTSCAASLAVKFANSGHPTILASTDTARPLSVTFSQDLSGGRLVPVEGVGSPLYAMEVALYQIKERFQSYLQLKDRMYKRGEGARFEQFTDPEAEDLIENPPPGAAESIAIGRVLDYLESPAYSNITRIVFDTAPSDHTLRLLSLPDFPDSSQGEMITAYEKLEKNSPDLAERLRGRMGQLRDLFHDPDSMEFVIVTIPTVTAVSESSILCRSLRKEAVPIHRLVVNQVLPSSLSDCTFCATKMEEQVRALTMIRNDPGLSRLRLVEAPMFGAEIRGVPALTFMGNSTWK